MKAIYRVHSQSASKYQSFKASNGIEAINSFRTYEECFWAMVHIENLVTETIDKILHVSDEMGKYIGKYNDEVFSFTDYTYHIEELSEMSKESIDAFAQQRLYTGRVWLKEQNCSGDYELLRGNMNVHIKDAVSEEIAPCTPQEFIDSYIQAHKAKFNETFPPAQY